VQAILEEMTFMQTFAHTLKLYPQETAEKPKQVQIQKFLDHQVGALNTLYYLKHQEQERIPK